MLRYDSKRIKLIVGLSCREIFERNFRTTNCASQWRASKEYDLNESSGTTEELLENAESTG